jgi:methionine-rich copper-binding protein CopC
MEPKDVSGPISHVLARVNQTVQQKRAGQINLLTEIETLLQDLLTRETLEIQDLLNPEGMKPEDHVSLQDHLIEVMEQDQVLDTVQIHLSAQLATIVASAPIVRLAISAAILFADPETHQETRQENPEEPTSHVQTPESMTVTATHTVKTEFQETSLATPALLALATRTQTAKHSLKTRF